VYYPDAWLDLNPAEMNNRVTTGKYARLYKTIILRCFFENSADTMPF
jgi:hypothetical protein